MREFVGLVYVFGLLYQQLSRWQAAADATAAAALVDNKLFISNLPMEMGDEQVG